MALRFSALVLSLCFVFYVFSIGSCSHLQCIIHILELDLWATGFILGCCGARVEMGKRLRLVGSVFGPLNLHRISFVTSLMTSAQKGGSTSPHVRRKWRTDLNRLSLGYQLFLPWIQGSCCFKFQFSVGSFQSLPSSRTLLITTVPD